MGGMLVLLSPICAEGGEMIVREGRRAAQESAAFVRKTPRGLDARYTCPPVLGGFRSAWPAPSFEFLGLESCYRMSDTTVGTHDRFELLQIARRYERNAGAMNRAVSG